MGIEQEIRSVLGRVMDADFRKDIVSLGWIKAIGVDQGHLRINVTMPVPLFPAKEALREEIAKAVRSVAGVKSVDVHLVSAIPGLPRENQGGLTQVKNIVAIGSGKGGVGKSTVAVNLAVGLAKYGARVGLVDGDIYGPTLPIMLGSRDSDLLQNERGIIPIRAHGVSFMSMGLLSKGSAPLIWRGPMAHKAIQESLLRVDWGELDYLLVDMPPGTGDVHLTLVQTVPVTGAVIVSTPQDVGMTISMKTLRLFEQTKVPMLGLIENMSYHVCSHCQTREDIFGHGGVQPEAEKLGIPFLGEIPLERQMREQADLGVPIVLSDTPIACTYIEILGRLTAQIALQNRGRVMIEEEAEEGETFTV
jgi:ATP-binding protein involved in chromosome partitioning